MRKCHIDKLFNFYAEETPSFHDRLKNTIDCDDELYEAIVAVDTLLGSDRDSKIGGVLDLDRDDLYYALNKLKAKVLLDEIERLKESNTDLLKYLSDKITKYRKLQTPLENLPLGADVGAMRGSKNAFKEVFNFIMKRSK